jgi:hypothetical protein
LFSSVESSGVADDEEELELEDCAHVSGAKTREAAKSSGRVREAVLRKKGTILFDVSRGV